MTSMETAIWLLVGLVAVGLICVTWALGLIADEQKETNRQLEYLAEKLKNR